MSRREDYDPEQLLAGLRFWQVVFVLAFVSVMPLVALSFQIPDLPFGALAWPSMIALAVASNRLYYYRCPGCRDHFIHSGFWFGYRNPFARKCIHCGFPKTTQQTPEG